VKLTTLPESIDLEEYPVAVLDRVESAELPAPQPVKRRSLWAIADDLSTLDDLVEEAEGDITECEETIDEWFARLGEEATSKLDGYAAFIKELEARSEARKEEADRLAKRARIDAALADWLKTRMKEFFILRGWKKVDTMRYRLSLVANGGKAPLVVDLPPEKIPPEYRKEKVVVSADNDKIRQELETGGTLEWARIGAKGSHVRIG